MGCIGVGTATTEQPLPPLVAAVDALKSQKIAQEQLVFLQSFSIHDCYYITTIIDCRKSYQFGSRIDSRIGEKQSIFKGTVAFLIHNCKKSVHLLLHNYSHIQRYYFLAIRGSPNQFLFADRDSKTMKAA